MSPYRSFKEAKAAQRAYYEKNRERLLAKAKDNRAKKLEQYREYEKSRYGRDKPKRIEQAKKYFREVTYPKKKKKLNSMRPLDILFSKIIRSRDGHCLRCGKTETLQCSHVVPRTFISTRWDPENAITLCYACHIHWWHKNPLEAAEWFKQKWPGRWEKMYQIANQHSKINREEKLSELQEMAKVQTLAGAVPEI